MTEPSGGSDLATLKTTAVRDGDDWVLNGSQDVHHQRLLRPTSSSSPPAPTRSKGAKGITLFVVEAGMDGFTRGRKLDKVGQDESDTAELFFEDVRVPDANRARRGGGGLHRDDAAAAAGAAGRGRREHRPRLRRSSTRPSSTPRSARPSVSRSGAFQHNKFMLAELLTKLEVTQAYVDQLRRRPRRGRAHPRRRREGQVVVSAQVQNEVLDDCVQLHGGYGFMNEYRVARAWRDARVSKIWAGSNEIMKELIGRDLGL